MSAVLMWRVSASSIKAKIAAAVALSIGMTLALVVVPATQASAAPDSVRSGQLTWIRVSPTVADFTYRGSWRSAAFDNVPVGSKLTPSPGCVDFNYTGAQSVCPDFIVSDRDTANGAVFATARFSHTFPGEGQQYIATMRPGDRVVANHANNPGQTAAVSAVVDLNGTTRSPIAQNAATIECRQSSICEFDIVATDADSQPMQFVMAGSPDGGTNFRQPPNATVTTSGQYRFDTRQAGPAGTLYSTQVIIRNVVNGRTVATTPTDFLIKLIPGENLGPYFVTPPTPEHLSVFTVNPGSTVAFDVEARDDDATDRVRLTATIPPGASFTHTTANPANPVRGRFSWTLPTTGTQDATVVLRATEEPAPAGQAPRFVERTIFIRTPPSARTTTFLRAHPTIAWVLPPSGDHTAIPGTLSIYASTLSSKLFIRDIWGNEAPLAGKPVRFFSGAEELCMATTDAEGRAVCRDVTIWVKAETTLGYEARFLGDSQYSPSTSRAGIVAVGGTHIGPV